MKYILSVLFLFFFFSGFTQIYQEMPQYGYRANRMAFDSTLQIPTVCGVPTLKSVVSVNKKSAIAFDSCNNRFYTYNPKTLTWSEVSGGGATPSLNDVATVGNFYVNDNGDTLRLNSYDGNVKHPILWTNDQYGGQPTNILDFSYNSGFSDNVAKIKFGEISGLGTGYIEITDKESIYKNELSTRTIIQNGYNSAANTQTTYFPLMKGGIDTLATLDDIRNSAIDTSNRFVNDVVKKNDSTITVYKGTTATDITLTPSTTVASATRLVTTVYNNSGSTITKGSVIYINGRHSSNLPTIALAQANSEDNSYATFALVQDDITNNNSGTIIQAGNISNLNLPTASFADGEVVYLSPTVAGGLTTNKTSVLAPNHIVKIGTITRAHPTLGSIEIRIENGWQLDELSDVQIPIVPNDSTLLQFSRVDSLWHSVGITNAIGSNYLKPTDSATMLTPYLRKIDTTNRFVNNISRTVGKDSIIFNIGSTRYAIKDSVGGGGSAAGSTGNVQYNNGGAFAGSNNLFWDNSNTRLGVAQSTPTSRFHLNFDQNSVTQSDANGILLANTTAAIAGTQSISPALVWQGNGWKTTATAASQDVRFRADVIPVQGTTNPTATWTLASSINGGAYINRYQTSSAGTHTFYDNSGTSLLTLNNTGTITMGGGQISNLVSITASSQFKSGSNTSTAAYRTTNAGSDITPTAFFGASETNTAGTLAYATDVNNGISFTAGNGTRQIARAGIKIASLTNTAGAESGDLTFLTQTGGTAMAERMRIFGGGNVNIGNAVDQGLKLYVGGTVGFSSTLSIGTSAAVGSQLQLAGTPTVNNVFSRLVSGGASTTPYLAAGNLGGTAGNTAITIDPTNQLSFMSINTGGFRTLRGSIQVTNLNNTAGSDAGDMIFLTQSGGTAMSEKMRITGAGGLTINATNTASGTTGNQTINKPSGTVNIAAAGTTVTVTNSLVSASSIVYAVIRTNDATATIKNVVPAAGSFTINLGAATTAETSIGFFVIN